MSRVRRTASRRSVRLHPDGEACARRRGRRGRGSRPRRQERDAGHGLGDRAPGSGCPRSPCPRRPVGSSRSPRSRPPRPRRWPGTWPSRRAAMSDATAARSAAASSGVLERELILAGSAACEAARRRTARGQTRRVWGRRRASGQTGAGGGCGLGRPPEETLGAPRPQPTPWRASSGTGRPPCPAAAAATPGPPPYRERVLRVGRAVEPHSPPPSSASSRRSKSCFWPDASV